MAISRGTAGLGLCCFRVLRDAHRGASHLVVRVAASVLELDILTWLGHCYGCEGEVERVGQCARGEVGGGVETVSRVVAGSDICTLSARGGYSGSVVILVVGELAGFGRGRRHNVI